MVIRTDMFHVPQLPRALVNARPAQLGRLRTSQRLQHRRKLVPTAAAQPAGSAPGEGASSHGTAPSSHASWVPDTVTAFFIRHAADPAALRQQQPTWAALGELLGSQRAAVALVRREPALLGMAPEAILRNVAVMLRVWGLSPDDARACVLRCPQLFLRDFASEEAQAKVAFFAGPLGQPPRAVLAQRPHLLLRSLAGMRRKVAFMEAKGDAHHYRSSLAWVTMSTSDFCWHYSYCRVEFEGFADEGWDATQAKWDEV